MQLTTHAPPTAALEHQEQLARAHAAIARLGDDERQVFLLKVSGDLTFAAVAAALQIPVGTAKTRMRSALLKLRERLATKEARR